MDLVDPPLGFVDPASRLVDPPSSPARRLDPASMDEGAMAVWVRIQRQWWGHMDSLAGPSMGLVGLSTGFFSFFVIFV